MDKQTIKYLIAVLRGATVTWSGRNECLNRGRTKRKVGTLKDGRDKYVWQNNCEGPCGKWFDQKDNALEVDHKVSIGSFTGDWTEYIGRMFCDQSNLQRLCHECHLRKTGLDNSVLRFKRKNLNSPGAVSHETDENFHDDIDPLEFL